TRRGDTWRESLSSKSARDRVRIDSSANAEVETTPMPGDPKNFPEETIAELRVLRVEKYSSVAIVTQSKKELVPGDVAVTHVGQ
ncbi:MAG TPA: hypothetical protein VGP93_18005, partial [Polyangiaceae bacterium]|nr:hypothetical protein [Polyangiaceae bacterium]